MRAWIVLGVIERFERHLEHDFVAVGASHIGQCVEIAAVGGEGQRYSARKGTDGFAGGRVAQSEPRDNNRDQLAATGGLG